MSDFRTLPSQSYHKPSLTYSYSDCGPVIEYNLTVVIVVHFNRGLECLNALLFCVYTESSTLYIFMLYMYSVHAYIYCVGGRICCSLWNRVYNVCTLYFLKGKEWG